MLNWNVDTKKQEAQQEKLKQDMRFEYLGHGPKATGFMAKAFKRKPGLYHLRLLHAPGRPRRGNVHLRQPAPHAAGFQNRAARVGDRDLSRT